MTTSRPSQGFRPAGLVLATLAASNVATHRWLPPVARVPWNLTLTALLVVLARLSGHSVEDLGLHRGRLGEGARVGAVGFLGVGAAYLALLRSGQAHALLADRRFQGLSRRDTLWRLLVQIPLGTVLTEEVVFRGVLPLVLRHPRQPIWAPSLLASSLFGLWHLLPAYEQASANQTAPVRLMVGTVVSTAVAGGLLHRLRARTGHVLAPIALHFAANGLGLLAIRAAHARR